ncbi:MAG: hypothetical protein JXR37_26405 [Kiritimatiellae bacterium]|nr:hypothetical protein [Kiritimatiellia bacterium]
MSDATDIQIYDKKPRYWQYKGEPVLLLGGTREDNLHQIPDLEEHLDLLQSVGGNYIRNVMSCRDEGDAWMFKRVGDTYDLDQWNEEHWRRFELLLKLTNERDIIVQIEVWAFHDFNHHDVNWFKDHPGMQLYDKNPWNPANNKNLTESNTRLKAFYGNIGTAPHDFFKSVPAVNNDTVLLGYQQKFVDKLLSYSLQYPNVLYCMTNEIHPQFSHEWGWYWARYIKEKAAAAGRHVHCTEMFWQPDFTHEQHKPSLDRPDIYSYFEASQNSAHDGEKNWVNGQYVYDYLRKKPRPMNNTKIYGADNKLIGGARRAEESFWRNTIGGCASSRFHRPPFGLGLSERSQAHIRSMRRLTAELDIFACSPHNDLLSDRRENGAYCTANPGAEYAVYFTNGGSVAVDLSAASGELTARWLDIRKSAWAKEEKVSADTAVTLNAPSEDYWVALIT